MHWSVLVQQIHHFVSLNTGIHLNIYFTLIYASTELRFWSRCTAQSCISVRYSIFWNNTVVTLHWTLKLLSRLVFFFFRFMKNDICSWSPQCCSLSCRPLASGITVVSWIPRLFLMLCCVLMAKSRSCGFHTQSSAVLSWPAMKAGYNQWPQVTFGRGGKVFDWILHLLAAVQCHSVAS